jgi:hypothetical protein
MSSSLPVGVARFFDGACAADAALWASGFAEDGQFFHPAGGKPVTWAQLEAFIGGAIGTFSRFGGLAPTGVFVVDAQHVAVAWAGTGVSAHGRPVRWSGVTTFELDVEGLITSAWAYADFAALGAQLQAGAGA